jgi:hypothetical protein
MRHAAHAHYAPRRDQVFIANRLPPKFHDRHLSPSVLVPCPLWVKSRHLPYIAVLNTWMSPAEITASDMPWAVAWYADRPSLWIPVSIKTLTDLSDYGALGGPVAALYLTPISGTQNTFRDIIKGDYSEWAPLIEQTSTLQGVPFKWGTLALGIDKECVFLSDHDRSRAENP